MFHKAEISVKGIFQLKHAIHASLEAVLGNSLDLAKYTAQVQTVKSATKTPAGAVLPTLAAAQKNLWESAQTFHSS